jgi:hypothetical protein
LILPFHERWKAKERLKRGLPLYAWDVVFAVDNPKAEHADGQWQARKPEVPKDATESAFSLLGLEKSAATEADVRRRYKALCFEHHPDRGGDVTKFHAVLEARDLCLAELKTR